MRNILLILLSICLISCVSLDQETSLLNDSSLDQKKPVLEVYKVKIGMTRQEVKAILKDELVVGYQIDGSPQKMDPITIKQPYREESITRDGTLYNVLYYYSAVIKPDNIISDDELMPFIFVNGRLVGKGLAELDKIKRL